MNIIAVFYLTTGMENEIIYLISQTRGIFPLQLGTTFKMSPELLTAEDECAVCWKDTATKDTLTPNPQLIKNLC